MLARLPVAVTAVTAIVLVSGCGSSGSSSSADTETILDTEKIERAIEASSLAQRRKHARVSCPSGVHQKKGLTFSCTALVKRDSTRFVVTQLDGSGQVHYEAR